MLREIVFDTETTGLNPLAGDRIVEIGCVELINHVPTGRTFHVYVNPERDMPADAFRIHGLSAEFLADKPVFAEVAEEFLAFVEERADGTPDPAKLVAHNGAFDLGFLNAEFARLSCRPISGDRLVDTLALTRAKFPGAPASLDALCRRFAVDLSARTLHGALLDSELLSEVYLGLMGGRQPGLEFAVEAAGRAASGLAQEARPRREPRPHAPTPEELTAWEGFLEQIEAPLWRQSASAN